MHFKLRTKQTPVLFYKYLRNEISDLHVVVNYYLVSFTFKFQGDPCTNTRARVVNPHMHVLQR